MILEISRLSQRSTLKSAMQMQKFCLVFVGPNYPESFYSRGNGLQKPLEISHGNPKTGEFRKRLDKPFNGEFSRLLYITAILVERKKFSKIWVSLWGCPLFFYYRKFQKTEKTIISFFSWNFGILKGNIMLLLPSSLNRLLCVNSISHRLRALKLTEKGSYFSTACVASP